MVGTYGCNSRGRMKDGPLLSLWEANNLVVDRIKALGIRLQIKGLVLDEDHWYVLCRRCNSRDLLGRVTCQDGGVDEFALSLTLCSQEHQITKFQKKKLIPNFILQNVL